MASRLDTQSSEQVSKWPRSDLIGVDQRAANRVSLLIRTAKLIADGHEFVCIIRDVSATGVKIRIFHPFPNSGTLLLETDKGDRYPIELIWRTRDHAGFRFVDEIDIRGVIDNTQGPFPRRQVRLRIALDARIYSGSGVSSVVFRDISQQGASIECDKWLLLNELVRIETNFMPPIYAKVRWRRPPQYGLVFEQTFRLEELAQLLASVTLDTK